MKKLMFVVLAFGTVDVFANCSSDLVADADAALSGKLVEDIGGTGREVHCSGGDLVELAKGAADPVDPTHKVGVWNASSTTGSVTYDYDGGSSYTFFLRSDGSKYYFCSSSSGGSVKASASLPLSSSSSGC